MIYNKDAAFSYPVLSRKNNSYIENGFYFNLSSITDTDDHYKLMFDYDIDSVFVQNLLEEERAVLIFIIQSKDNLFFTLKKNQKEVQLRKSRISFNEKVRFQLHIQSKEEISFAECEELNSFYSRIKDQLAVSKNTLIGYSDTSTLRNLKKENVPLFKKSVDPSMDVEFQVRLSSDSIILKFKNEKHLLRTTAAKIDIMNLYFYNGLYQAVSHFIQENIEEDEDSLFLSKLDDTALNNLNYKIYHLMVKKGLDEINGDMTDEIIQKLAPKIISKFTGAVERLNRYED